MDEKKLNVVLEALAEVIDDLRFKLRLLQNENERIAKERDFWRGKYQEDCKPVVFEKIERPGEKDGKL
jgi:hypothetical protein